jgi:hypothetical protein
MSVTEARPPYVTFEMRVVEDRNASIEAGHYVAKDVAFALLTPQGSKDIIPRIADEWFAGLEVQVREGRFRPDWLREFRTAYEAWKRDEEPPLNGTPLRNWPPISPAQYKALRNLRVLTVEDLAAANEETIARMGMGSRSLKQKAIDWLAQATDRSVEEVSALRVANQDMARTLESMQAQMAQMAQALEKRGIPVPGAAVETAPVMEPSV